jgi:hypothetical protein
MQTTTETGSRSVATDETDRLIASNKVEGTAVYNRQGERLGSVYYRNIADSLLQAIGLRTKVTVPKRTKVTVLGVPK